MALEADIELLRRLDVFARVDPVRLQVLAFTAERRAFKPGEALFEEGEPADAAFVVLSGSGAMMTRGADGGPEVGRIDEGDLIDESALLVEGRRRSTVRAASPLEAMVISRVLFKRLMMEFPEMSGGLARGATARLEALASDLRALDRRMARGEPGHEKKQEKHE